VENNTCDALALGSYAGHNELWSVGKSVLDVAMR